MISLAAAGLGREPIAPDSLVGLGSIGTIGPIRSPLRQIVLEEIQAMCRCLRPALALMVGCLAFPAAAQPPLPLPNKASDQELHQMVVPLSEPVRRRIEEALRRQEADPGGAVASTGDPILDDILDVIRRQGSVLDGSVLDPQLDQQTLQPPALPQDEVQAIVPVPRLRDTPPQTQLPRAAVPGLRPGDTDHPGFNALSPDARFHVAESLLRAARELAALRTGNESTDRLVAAMREQATMLLIDEYSEDGRFE